MREFLIVGFFLTAPMTSSNSMEQNAYRNASDAFYKTSGLDIMVDSFVREQLEDVPEEVQRTASNIFLIAKTLQERKVVYTWTF